MGERDPTRGRIIVRIRWLGLMLAVVVLLPIEPPSKRPSEVPAFQSITKLDTSLLRQCGHRIRRTVTLRLKRVERIFAGRNLFFAASLKTRRMIRRHKDVSESPFTQVVMHSEMKSSIGKDLRLIDLFLLNEVKPHVCDTQVAHRAHRVFSAGLKTL